VWFNIEFTTYGFLINHWRRWGFSYFCS